jgi:glycosyltransferase involved in cell wall biosynthesis
LTYDLQPFTQELLARLQNALRDMRVAAYPCFFHVAQGAAQVEFLPSSIRAKPFGVSGRGVREAFTSSTNLRAAWKIAWENDAVLLYGLQGTTALLAVLFARLLRRRVISVNHSLGPEMERHRRWWVRGLKRMLLSGCHWHISQMPAARRTLIEVYGVSQERVTEAPFEGGASLYRPMALQRSERRARTRKLLGIGDEETVYLYVGNIIPLKGPGLFIRAMAKLSALPVRAILAGPEEPGYGIEGTIAHYRALAADMGVADRVHLTGPMDLQRLADLYAASDVFVLPTFKDCMPKAFIEAALFRLPIITTNAPGSVGILPAPGKNGYAVPIGDLDALAEAMLSLHDKQLRNAFAQSVKAAVDAFCDPQKEISGFVEAVHSALRTRGQRRKVDGR